MVTVAVTCPRECATSEPKVAATREISERRLLAASSDMKFLVRSAALRSERIASSCLPLADLATERSLRKAAKAGDWAARARI